MIHVRMKKVLSHNINIKGGSSASCLLLSPTHPAGSQHPRCCDALSCKGTVTTQTLVTKHVVQTHLLCTGCGQIIPLSVPTDAPRDRRKILIKKSTTWSQAMGEAQPASRLLCVSIYKLSPFLPKLCVRTKHAQFSPCLSLNTTAW